MMKDFIIRPFEEKDKVYCMEAFRSNVPMYFTESEVFEFEAFLDNHILNRNQENYRTHYFVLLINEKPVACGGFGERYLDGNLTLAWGLVHIDFHKKGLGKELLIYRLKAIKELYPTSAVCIDTIQHSSGFFEKYGFKTLKITKDFYAPGLDRIDMIWNNLT